MGPERGRRHRLSPPAGPAVPFPSQGARRQRRLPLVPLGEGGGRGATAHRASRRTNVPALSTRSYSVNWTAGFVMCPALDSYHTAPPAPPRDRGDLRVGERSGDDPEPWRCQGRPLGLPGSSFCADPGRTRAWKISHACPRGLVHTASEAKATDTRCTLQGIPGAQVPGAARTGHRGG